LEYNNISGGMSGFVFIPQGGEVFIAHRPYNEAVEIAVSFKDPAGILVQGVPTWERRTGFQRWRRRRENKPT
jgi:hypothetical protein